MFSKGKSIITAILLVEPTCCSVVDNVDIGKNFPYGKIIFFFYFRSTNNEKEVDIFKICADSMETNEYLPCMYSNSPTPSNTNYSNSKPVQAQLTKICKLTFDIRCIVNSASFKYSNQFVFTLLLTKLTATLTLAHKQQIIV